MAVEVRLSAADVARVRLAVSPLTETVLGVRAALGTGGHEAHRRWVREAQPVLAREPELALLQMLLGRLVPSFLLPVPAERLPAFETELAALRAMDPAYVTAECAAVLGSRARELPPPAELVERVADALVRCHGLLVAPHWGRMRAVLEADLSRLAVVLVDSGVEGLFAHLPGDLVWQDAGLRVHGRRVPDRVCTVEAGGHGLVLMPTVFGWPNIGVDHSPCGTTSILYPASGIGPLWERPRPASGALAALLGRTRAALLCELAEPLSTPDLAARLGVTASAVSQHLGALRGAGLVTTRRTGRTAIHLRTPTGTYSPARKRSRLAGPVREPPSARAVTRRWRRNGPRGRLSRRPRPSSACGSSPAPVCGGRRPCRARDFPDELPPPGGGQAITSQGRTFW